MEVLIITQLSKSIYGLWMKSSDKTISKDIPALSKRYYDAIGEMPKSVLPFFVLSKDYDEASGQFHLFVGGEVQHEQLDAHELPAGDYGKITVKPKLGFIWGLAIGEAKQYFYTKWLPASEYKALNMEYEYHTEKSIRKKPEIDILFLIEKRV